MTTIINGLVATETELNAAIALANGETVAGSYEIDLNGTAIDTTQVAPLATINLKSGVSLTINGEGLSIDGGGSGRGLFVYSGAVNIQNLIIENMVAQGGAGANGNS
jgi:hypothetical protein